MSAFGFTYERYVPPNTRNNAYGAEWFGYPVSQDYTGAWVGIVVHRCGHVTTVPYGGSRIRGIRAYVSVEHSCGGC